MHPQSLLFILFACLDLLEARSVVKTLKDSSADISFPRRFTPLSKGLLRLIQEYRNQLYPEGPSEESAILPILRNAKQHSTFSAPPNRATLQWTPIECKVAGIDLRKVSLIHQGSRNVVHKVYDQVGKKVYALKTFADPDEYTAELSFLSLANHPNIVRPICIQSDRKTSYPGLVIEYVDGMSSREYAKTHRGDFKVLQRISAQLYDVIKYMHWLNYIHADIKPENVLIDRYGNVKAIDFGFAIVKPYFKHYRGTPSTNSPELMKLIPKAAIMENIDWWAFGATIAMWAAIDQLPKIYPTGGKHSHRWILLRISRRQGYYFGPVPKEFPRQLRQVLYYCLSPYPTRRRWATGEQLAWFESLPFWDGIDFEQIGFPWRSITSSMEPTEGM